MLKSVLMGIGSFFSRYFMKANPLPIEIPDVAVVKGENYFDATIKAVEIIGGMSTFVPKNSSVAILANTASNNPGTYTKPEIAHAIIKMCKEVGVKKIGFIGWLSKHTYENTGYQKIIDAEGVDLVVTDFRNESLFKKVPVPKGEILKEARILKSFYDFDCLINLSISKEHSGNCFSGVLKNLMGMNSPVSDQSFHRSDPSTGKDSIPYLEQCIADLNTIIHPQLCISDSTEFIITNGPMGPGKLKRPYKVVAGTDRVAIEAYCASFFGLNPRNVLGIQKAHEHGLGEIDLSKVNIKEVEIYGRS